MNLRQHFLSRPKIFIGDGAAEMWPIKLGAIAFLAAMLTGCGTYVPGIPEFALQPGSTQRLVQVILDSIHCEIKNSVEFIRLKTSNMRQIIRATGQLHGSTIGVFKEP
jgi:hypothetical protein